MAYACSKTSAFAAALRTAIHAKDLGLERIQERLAREGIFDQPRDAELLAERAKPPGTPGIPARVGQV